MAKDLKSWTKYTYVCDPDECDSLIQFTCKNTFGFPSGSVTNITCPCGRKPILLSVEDATIGPLTTNPKGQEMETTTMFLENQVNVLTDLREKQENLIESLQNKVSELSEKIGPNHQNCDYWKAENGRVQGQIISLIDSYHEEDTDADTIIEELCQIVDYNPKKEIEFTATIKFTGRIDVDMSEYKDGFDLTALLEDAYVDINNGDVVIDNYELYDAEEC